MKKYLGLEEARKKIRHFCAYRDRSHQEVMDKLRSYGVREEWRSALCVELMEQGYLNEKRFADAYVRGKLNQNQWGPYKIRAGLRQKGITERMIEEVFKETGEEAFDTCLQRVIEKKAELLGEKNEWIRREKLSKYALGKGFEPFRISRLLDELKA